MFRAVIVTLVLLPLTFSCSVPKDPLSESDRRPENKDGEDTPKDDGSPSLQGDKPKVVALLCDGSARAAVRTLEVWMHSRDCDGETATLREKFQALSGCTVTATDKSDWSTQGDFRECRIKYHYHHTGPADRRPGSVFSVYNYGAKKPAEHRDDFSASVRHGWDWVEIYPDLVACESDLPRVKEEHFRLIGGELLLAACNSIGQSTTPGAAIQIIGIGGNPALQTYTDSMTYGSISPAAREAWKTKLAAAGGNLVLDPVHSIFPTLTFVSSQPLETHNRHDDFFDEQDCNKALQIVSDRYENKLYLECRAGSEGYGLTIVPDPGVRIITANAFDVSYSSVEACRAKIPEAEATYRRKVVCSGSGIFRLTIY